MRANVRLDEGAEIACMQQALTGVSERACCAVCVCMRVHVHVLSCLYARSLFHS